MATLLQFRWGYTLLEHPSDYSEPRGFISQGDSDGHDKEVLHVSKDPTYHVGDYAVVPGNRYKDGRPDRPQPGYGWKKVHPHDWEELSNDGSPSAIHACLATDEPQYCYVLRSYDATRHVIPAMTRAELDDYANNSGLVYLVAVFFLPQLHAVGRGDVTELEAYEAASQLRIPFKEIDDHIYEMGAELKFNSNNIANVGSVIDLTRSLRNPKEIFDNVSEMTAKDAWLQYRYVYNTTKADIEETGRLLHQLDKGNRGTLRSSFTAAGVVCHLKMSYWPYDNEFLKLAMELISLPKRVGLSLSPLNAWDMIPFSFIADWFLPIGDSLERLDNMFWLATMPYQYKILASVKGSVVYNGVNYHIYRRFFTTPSMRMEVEDDISNSKVTWGKRALDVVALSGRKGGQNGHNR